MDENQIFQLGPLQIPVNWLVLMIGFVIAIFITERLAKKKGWEKERWSDLMITLIVSFLFVYKFGWAIFDLKRVIANPASLFWTSGNAMTIFLAVLATVIVFWLKWRKNRYPVVDLLDLSWITLTVTFFIYQLFIMDYGKTTNFITGVSINEESSYLYHPVNWYKAIWIGILLIIRYRQKENISLVKIMYYYILLGIGLLFITLFDFSIHLILGFAIEQWIYVIVILLSSAVLVMKKG